MTANGTDSATDRPGAAPDDAGRAATVRDARASRRDAAAQRRDERAMGRDRAERARQGDNDRAFPDRFLSAGDRDEAAGDRAEARADRQAAERDRDAAAAPIATEVEGQAHSYAMVVGADARAVMREAQGVLMERAKMSAGESFAALRSAVTAELSLNAVARHVVAQGALPIAQDAT